MSNILIKDIIGINDFSVPTDDTELATATNGLDSILSGVSGLIYLRVLAWVEDSGGPGGAEGVRVLSCLVEAFNYGSDECPSESEVNTLVGAIETALENDSDIISIGAQEYDIFAAESSVSGGSGGEESNLWYPPSSPHAQDDEFDGSSIGSEWIVYDAIDEEEGLFLEDQVDIYDNFSTGYDIRANINSPSRPSWLIMQPPASNNGFYVYKPYSVPTNLLMIARLKFNTTNAAQLSNDANYAIIISPDNGSGRPDGGDTLYLFINEQDGSDCRAQYQRGGSVISTSSDVDFKGQALEYAALHKIGTTYHAWVGTYSGNWIYMGSTTESSTMSYVGFTMNNNTTNLPGSKALCVDFVRFYETDNFLF